MEIDALVGLVNARHGFDFVRWEPRTGGFQEGAWLLTDGSGTRLVLKRTRVGRSVMVNRQLRDAGYPTPAFLAWGAAPGGEPYLLLEFVDGAPLEELTIDFTRQLITINRRQRNLNSDQNNPRPDGNWSDYMSRVVFADESGWASTLHAHSPETRRLLGVLERASAPWRDTRFPVTDAVHGDWSPGNLLAQNGHITGVIDCAYAGYGTRGIDLATLLQDTYGDNTTDDVSEIRMLLRDEIVAIGGAPLLIVSLVYRTMAMVEFAIRVHGDGVAAFTRRGWRVLEDFERLL